jgi:DNA-binding MarR family transcriptional regulator
MTFERMDSATYLSGLMAKGFSRALSTRAAGLGFSVGQFPVLVELWQNDGLTQRQLLDLLDIEQATLANTLTRMVRDGLIERRPHPSDRRASLNVLTERGRCIEVEAKAAAAEADAALFAGFRRFEKELLLEYMRRAIDNAGEL